MALELDAGNRIFTTLPVVKVNRGRAGEAALDFAHFANGASIVSEMVFMNLETQPSGPPLTPLHQAIPPTRPVIYFYDTEGNPIDPALLVDLTGDLEITEDGSLSIQSEMEPLGELTISTYGRGGHCQSKVAGLSYSTEDRGLGLPELTPLGKGSGAVELEIIP